MGEGERSGEMVCGKLEKSVKFYIDKAKSLVGVTAPGFEDKNGPKDYIKMVCRDLRESAKNPDPKTNPNFVKIEGVAVEDYPMLVSTIEAIARKEGLV
ncbi:MAG: hypothetical protein AAB963_02300 [Patescibacteria group bacterium]